MTPPPPQQRNQLKKATQENRWFKASFAVQIQRSGKFYPEGKVFFLQNFLSKYSVNRHTIKVFGITKFALLTRSIQNGKS